MRVREVMTTEVLMVDGTEMVPVAARRMIERWVGSALVKRKAPGSSLGIITERDILTLIGKGEDPGTRQIVDRCTQDPICARPHWSLAQAAEAMEGGDFRHLVVIDEERTVGIISIRDVVRAWAEGPVRQATGIQIRAAMSRDPLIVGGDDTIREAARQMVEHGVAAAVIEPRKPKSPPGIFTDRELLQVVAAGQDPDSERVCDHLSSGMTFSAPDWSLKQAAEAMTTGGFQHVVVVDGSGTVGIISMSDIVGRLLD